MLVNVPELVYMNSSGAGSRWCEEVITQSNHSVRPASDADVSDVGVDCCKL